MAFTESSRNVRVALKPLASALMFALAAGGVSVDAVAASAPDGAATAARMQVLRHYLAQAGSSPEAQQLRALFPSPGKIAAKPSGTLATLTVNSCTDDASSATTSGSLRYAVLNAADGDTVDLSGLACSNITLTQGALPVSVNNLTVQASTTHTVTIDANHADRAFLHTGTGTLSLDYLTIINGSVSATAPPLVKPITPASLPPFPAGGCIASSGMIVLDHTTVSGCTATDSNGPAFGGGVFAQGLTMTSSTLSSNTVQAGDGPAIGGGAFVYGKYPTTITGSTISGNSAVAQGVTTSAISLGGGIFASSPYLDTSTVSGNSVHVSTAGFNASNKYAAIGGGIGAFGLEYGLYLSHSTVTGNSATCAGPKTYCLGGAMIGKYSGSGPRPALGVLANGSSYIGYSTIDNNHSDLVAGGIYLSGGLNVTESTISGNTAAAAAGLLVGSTGTTTTTDTIYNSTIAMNTATGGSGGGIYAYNNGYLSVTMTSTLVAKNTAAAGADIYTPTALTIAGSNNLVMAWTNVGFANPPLTADPLLQALANNGGPTRTQALSPGSPAVGAGLNPNNDSFDQRGAGFPRVVGAAPDIGAFEGVGVLALAAPLPVPALSPWALGLLGGLLGWIGLRRRKIPS